MASATEIAKAYVQIVPTTKGIQSSLENELGLAGDSAGQVAGGNFGTSFGNALGAVGKATAGAITAAAAGVTALASQAVSEFANFEQLVGGVETLFEGEGASIVMENAANAFKTAGLSANEYMETVTSFSASLLQSLEGDTVAAANVSDMALRDMADNANKMGTDMMSIQNAYQGFAKQNYTMLDNLKLGYGGTKTEMERLLADASALSGVEYDISNLSDVYEAIHVIQEEMGITGTTALEASDTISGSAGSMSAAWKNLMVGLVDDGADFDGLINNLVSSISQFASNMLPRFASAIGGIGDLVAGLAPVVAEMLPILFEELLPILLESVVLLLQSLTDALPELLMTVLSTLPDLIDAGFLIVNNLILGISQALPTLIPEIVNIMIQIVNTLIANVPLLVSSALTLIQGLATGLINAIPTLIQAIPTIIDGLVNALVSSVVMIAQAGITLITALVANLPEIINQIVAVIPDIMNSLINALIENYPVLAEAGFQLITCLVSNIDDILLTIGEALMEIIANIVVVLIDQWPEIKEAGYDLLCQIVSGIADVLTAVGDAVLEIIDAIVGVFEDSWNTITEIGGNIVLGLWEGISASVDWLIEKIEEFCDGVWETICEFFGIASPAKEMKWVGQMLDEGLAIGIEDSEDNAIQAALGMSEDIMGVFDNMNPSIEPTLKGSTDLTVDEDAAITDLTNAVAMLQASMQILNDRMDAGIDIEWDDRQLGRLVQTYA